MPDLTTLLAVGEDPGLDPGHDPGLDPTVPEPAPARRTGHTRVDTRAAVDTVLALLGNRAPAPAADTPTATPRRRVLPSARTRAALDQLNAFGTVENLEAAQIDVKALCRDLFDWDTPTQSRATKTMVKAVATVLLARDVTGRSLYPQALEMLSFAAAAAPLLETDRLARLVATAPTVPTAFRPEMYTMQLASALWTILVRYQPARREQLLMSLWTQAHRGRWWDMTSGVIAIKTGHGRATGEAEKERRKRADESVIDVLAGAAEGTSAAHAVVGTALVNGDLAYSEGTARLVSALPPSAALADTLMGAFARLAAGQYVDPDIALLASHLPWLLPAQRPESPLTWLVKTLVTAITPDPETGEAAVEKLPDRPKGFSDLFPMAELTTFPFPAAIRQIHETLLPGTTDGNVLVKVIWNPHELALNARVRMMNCTFGLKPRMEKGACVLLALWRDGECWNAALDHSPTGWSLAQINSFANGKHGHRVPEDVTAGVRALIGQLGAPGPLPEPRGASRRKVRYTVV